MNELNRTAIVLLAAVWIVLMAVIIFLAWAAPGDAIEALGDVVQEMEDNNDTAGRMVITLGALAFAVFGLLIIILELAPEDEERELRVKQAGSTTIVPAQALRQRVEEAIGALPEVTAVKARVWTKDNAIATNLDLGLLPRANVANVTQEATRLVVDIVQTELGLPVAGLPEVRISFGGEKPPSVAATAGGTVDASSMFRRPTDASSTFQRPLETPSQSPQVQPQMDPREMLGGADDAPPPEPPVVDATEGTADSSPGPLAYDEQSPVPPPSAAGEEPSSSHPALDAADPTPESPATPPPYGGESRRQEGDKPADDRQI